MSTALDARMLRQEVAVIRASSGPVHPRLIAASLNYAPGHRETRHAQLPLLEVLPSVALCAETSRKDAGMQR